MDAVEAVRVPGSEKALGPFFSPDGEWVAFAAVDGRAEVVLKKAPVAGGDAVTLTPVARDYWGGSWGPDDTIVYADWPALWAVPAAGGEREPLTTLDRTNGELVHGYPHVLRSGRAVLYTAFQGEFSALESPRVLALPLDGGGPIMLVEDASNPVVTPTGHLPFIREGALLAAAFDPSRLQLTGAPVPVLEHVMMSRYESAHVGVANNGTLVYVRSDLWRNERRLVWVDRSGAETPATAHTRAFAGPRVSPDGRRLQQISQRTFSRLGYRRSPFRVVLTPDPP